MDDLVKRLQYSMSDRDGGIGLEAADRIEDLEKRISDVSRMSAVEACAAIPAVMAWADCMENRLDEAQADQLQWQTYRHVVDRVEGLERQFEECEAKWNMTADALVMATNQLAECQRDGEEQARLLGMSGSREAKLLSELEQCQRERDKYREAFAAANETNANYSAEYESKLGKCQRDLDLCDETIIFACIRLSDYSAACQMALDALNRERIMCADGSGNYTIEATAKHVHEAIAKLREVLK